LSIDSHKTNVDTIHVANFGVIIASYYHTLLSVTSLPQIDLKAPQDFDWVQILAKTDNPRNDRANNA